MEMRRKELAVTEPEKIDAIITSCDCFRLAFADGTHPYIVPLSFGYERQGTVQRFYFHSAGAGRKVTLCRTLGYAGFELDNNRRLKPQDTACGYSMAYQSVVGEGTLRELTDSGEKTRALQCVMKQYSGRDDWEMPSAAVEKTCVFCLTVTELSAKEHG